MHFAFTSIFTLAAAVAVAQPARALSLNPDPRIFLSGDLVKPKAQAKPATNAKRFALGLPPMKPRRRYTHNGRAPALGGSPAGSGRRAVPSSSPPSTKRCNILVKNASDGAELGYIAPAWNLYGEYGIMVPTSKQATALEVSFSYSPGAGDSSLINLLASNTPDAAYPYVGAVIGFSSTDDNLSTGRYNYAYITGTTQIPNGPPQGGEDNSFSGTTGIPESAESSIWVLNSATKELSPRWTNDDGSVISPTLFWADDDNQAFAMTGDFAELQSSFGTSYPAITFTCVEPK